MSVMSRRRYLALGSLFVVLGTYAIVKDVSKDRGQPSLSFVLRWVSGAYSRYNGIPAKRNITCRKPKFANPHLPVTALASYPGSGNTWFRHLLQKATGIYTGSVYNDGDLRKHGFLGEGRSNGSVIAVKLHDPCHPLTQWCLKKYDRAILLMRDARGAGKAEFNRGRSNHVGQAKPEALLRDLPKFLEKEFSNWKSTNMVWLSIKEPLLMVDYDELKLDPKKEMSKVFDFLKFPVSEDDLECMLRDSEGKFHRKANQTMPKFSADYNKKADQAKELMKTRYEQRQQNRVQ